jgi:hypothetical protein
MGRLEDADLALLETQLPPRACKRRDHGWLAARLGACDEPQAGKHAAHESAQQKQAGSKPSRSEGQNR